MDEELTNQSTIEWRAGTPFPLDPPPAVESKPNYFVSAWATVCIIFLFAFGTCIPIMMWKTQPLQDRIGQEAYSHLSQNEYHKITNSTDNIVQTTIAIFLISFVVLMVICPPFRKIVIIAIIGMITLHVAGRLWHKLNTD